MESKWCTAQKAAGRQEVAQAVSSLLPAFISYLYSGGIVAKGWVLGSEASTLSPSFAIHWLCDLGELISSLPSSGSSSVKLTFNLSPHMYNICEVSGPRNIRHGRHSYLHFLSKGTDAKRGGRVNPKWRRRRVADPGTKVDERNCPIHAAGPSSPGCLLDDPWLVRACQGSTRSRFVPAGGI